MVVVPICSLVLFGFRGRLILCEEKERRGKERVNREEGRREEEVGSQGSGRAEHMAQQGSREGQEGEGGEGKAEWGRKQENCSN